MATFILDNSNNTKSGTSSADLINGKGGNDTLHGLAGNDTLKGGYGRDFLYGDSGNDTLQGESGRDYLAGGDGNDHLSGGYGSDTLVGGNGADFLDASNGNDVIYADRFDDINGGDGRDAAVFSSMVNGTLSDSRLGNVETIRVEGAFSFNFSAQSESFTIIGDSASNTIIGGAGNDTIFADATDVINGGGGTNTATFKAPVFTSQLSDSDLVNVSTVNAAAAGFFHFGAQSEALNVIGDAHNQSFLLAVGTGSTLDGGGGRDDLFVNTTVSAADFADSDLINVERVRMLGANSFDFSAQTEGLVFYHGDSNQVTLTAGAGRDYIYGRDSDIIDGGAFWDKVVYGSVADGVLSDGDLSNVEMIRMSAAASYDFSAQTENLRFYSTSSGTRDLTSGSGADIIEMRDFDIVDGGAGSDTAIFRAAVGAANLTDGDLSNVERIKLVGAHNFDFSGQSEKLFIYSEDSVQHAITGGSAADTVTVRDTDIADGGSGIDLAIFNTDVSAANLADSDLVSFERVRLVGTHTFDLSAQTENLVIYSKDWVQHTLTAGSGIDSITMRDIDIVDGGAGRDTAIFKQDVSAANLADSDLTNIERIKLYGINRSFDFSAQTEALQIISKSIRATITGGSGDDTITGGAVDRFVFGVGSGDDRITGGFDQGVDRISFTSGASSFSDLTIAQNGADVDIAYAGGAQTITVAHALATDFSAADFLF